MEELKFGDLLVPRVTRPWEPKDLAVLAFLRVGGHSGFGVDIYETICIYAPGRSSWHVGTHVRILASGWDKKEAQ